MNRKNIYVQFCHMDDLSCFKFLSQSIKGAYILLKVFPYIYISFLLSVTLTIQINNLVMFVNVERLFKKSIVLDLLF